MPSLVVCARSEATRFGALPGPAYAELAKITDLSFEEVRAKRFDPQYQPLYQQAVKLLSAATRQLHKQHKAEEREFAHWAYDRFGFDEFQARLQERKAELADQV